MARLVSLRQRLGTPNDCLDGAASFELIVLFVFGGWSTTSSTAVSTFLFTSYGQRLQSVLPSIHRAGN